MTDEIPSPADREIRRGPIRLPWESALYDAVSKLEARAVEAEQERDRLILRIHKLEKALGDCRNRLESWQLRQAAWRRERAELLGRLR